MDPLKEMFNKSFYEYFASAFKKVYTPFDPGKFVKEVTKDIEGMSLNQRLRNTSLTLKKHLPTNYKKSAAILIDAAPSLRNGYTSLVLPDFVALYGKDDFDVSMEALKYFTTIGSSEFAVREFLKHDLHKTLAVMNRWAEDKNHHIRRLSSEGSRPRLPWSFKLDEIIKDPKLTQTILEKLKADEELYVRKSVANHLNDISKDNTAYMLQLVKSWDKTNPQTSWIIKHASRSLIKKGHGGSLAVFDFEKKVKIRVDKFKLGAATITLGDTLSFGFQITSQKSTSQKLVIDYAVHYIKSAGGLSRKVFKLKEINLLPGQQLLITKKQVFKDFTTRKHYKGKHVIEIMVNGKKMGEQFFRLV